MAMAQTSTEDSEGGKLYGSRGRGMESNRGRFRREALRSDMGLKNVAADRRRTGDTLENEGPGLQLFLCGEQELNQEQIVLDERWVSSMRVIKK